MNNTSESKDFFKRNECEQNLVVMSIFFYTPLAGLAMIIGWGAGAFPGPVYPFIGMFVALALQSLLMRMFCKKNPGHPAIKYYIVVTTELLVFMLTINESFEPFISYALVPLISCVYFDRRFCLRTSAFSYVLMIISVIIRAQPANPLGEGLTSLQWGVEYGIGLTIEFALNVFVLSLVSTRHFDALNENLQSIETFQSMQDELVNGYSDLLYKTHQTHKMDIKRCQAVVNRLCEMLKGHRDYPELQDEEVVSAIVSSVPLHDIGLIDVPDNIVSKNFAYTAEEEAEYQKHVKYGEKLIRKNFYMTENREFLMIARQSALHHHEHWDGTGYPDNLFGIAIPVCARLIAVADELERRVAGDIEHPAITFEMALTQIQKLSGTVLDPIAVDALLASRISLEELYSSTQNNIDCDD